MKNPCFVAIILISLTAIICLEFLGDSPRGRFMRRTSHPDQTSKPEAAPILPSLKVGNARTIESETRETSPLIGSQTHHSVRRKTLDSSVPIKVASTPGRRIYAINSQQIQKEGQELDPLILNQVLAEIAPSSLILDLDGTSNTEIPFVLYANPERNLTPIIKERYLRRQSLAPASTD